MFERKDLIDDFIAKVTSVDFEDYGSFKITQISGNDDEIALDCLITIDDDGDFPKSWIVKASGVRKNAVSLGWVDNVSFHTDHVLLKEFSDPVLRLGFRGVPENPLAVLGSLYKSHVEYSNSWIDFSAFFHDREVTSLLKSGFGVLAEGPKSFVDIYDGVLRSYGIETKISGTRDPVEWSGSEFKEYPKLKVLVFDHRFVVAEHVSATFSQISD
ncbi:MAG: hypothetical protein QM785_17605 [Pyrinomonadaceae bacterium]